MSQCPVIDIAQKEMWARRATTASIVIAAILIGIKAVGWFLTDSGFAMARGYGGQVIAFHPERDLAVAITSDPMRPARSQGYFGTIMALMDGPILAMS